MRFGETKSVWQRGLLVAALFAAATLIMSCGGNDNSAAVARSAEQFCEPGQNCTIGVACGNTGMLAHIPIQMPPVAVKVTFRTPTQVTCPFETFGIYDKGGQQPAPGWSGQTFTGDKRAVTYTYDGTPIDANDSFKFQTTQGSAKDDGSGTISNR